MSIRLQSYCKVSYYQNPMKYFFIIYYIWVIVSSQAPGTEQLSVQVHRLSEQVGLTYATSCWHDAITDQP